MQQRIEIFIFLKSFPANLNTKNEQYIEFLPDLLRQPFDGRQSDINSCFRTLCRTRPEILTSKFNKYPDSPYKSMITAKQDTIKVENIKIINF